MIPKTMGFSPLAKTDGVTAVGATVIKIDSTFNEGINSFVDASVSEPGEAVLALEGFDSEDPTTYMSITFTERDTVNNELKGVVKTGGTDQEWPSGTEIQANPTAYLLNLLKAYVNGKLSTNATATGAVTIDLNDGNVHELTLTGDVTLTVDNAHTTHTFDLIIHQDATVRLITWFSGIEWEYSGAAPSTNVNNATYRFRFFTTDGVNWQGKEIWRNFWPQYQGLVKFGTLQYEAAELARPTYPWRSDHTYDGNAGNIHEFDQGEEGDAMTDYSLINTSSTDGNVLWWHKFVIGEKTLYICDRNILANLSWDDLNSDDWVSGKSVTIDGTTYTGRLLTGGSDTRTGTGQTAGDERYLGGSTPNEWDTLMLNGDTQQGSPYVQGAPAPATKDMPYGTSLAEDNGARLSAHNQAWHWISMLSWCQEVADYDNALRVARGYSSARFWRTRTSGYTNVTYGWRPCLEL